MKPPLQILLTLTLFLPPTASLDVVGWFVGTDESSFSLDDVQWDVYSTIRCGYIQYDPDTGAASRPADAFFEKCRETALAHNSTVTLGPGDLPIEDCIYSSDPSTKEKCDNYIATLGDAIRSCGEGVTGIDFDHEGDHTALGKAGVVSSWEANAYSSILDRMQKSMGDGYTVSADIQAWGYESIWGGADSFPIGYTPWVDADIFAANPNRTCERKEV
jgi:hypothetical protein